MGEGWEGVTLPASSREMKKHSADRGQVPIGRYTAHFVCHEARLTVEIDGVHKTIADALSGITPTRTLPLQGGGFLSGFGPARRRLLMAMLLLAPTGLTCCTAQSSATKLDDRTFKIEGPGVPGGAEAPNRRLAERVCPGGYRVLNSQRFKADAGEFGSSADIHTNWVVRCL